MRSNIKLFRVVNVCSGLNVGSLQCVDGAACRQRGKRLQQTSAAATETHNTDTPRGVDYENAKPFREIPGPIGLPYLGTLLYYRSDNSRVRDFHKVLVDRYRKYGPIYKETLTGETTVHIMHPDYVQTVYMNEGKIPYIVPLLETAQRYRNLRQMSPGLGNTNGEEWYRLRSAVQRLMLDLQSVGTFLPLVNKVADDFVNRLDTLRDPATGCIEQLYNEVAKWNLESSAMTCFETRFGCLEADSDSWQQQMLNANNEIFRLSLKLRFSVPWYKLFKTPNWKKLIDNEDFFFGKGQEFIDETCAKINKLEDEGGLADDDYRFLRHLLSRKELSYKDISIIVLSLFSDGLGTTVPTLVGQLFCLANNPDKQQKLYEEIARLLPDSSQPVTYDVITQSTYLKACIKESFRFFPIGVDVSRIPQKNLVIGGYQIPAGTRLSLNNNMLLRLPEYFTNPDDFVPERWVRGGSAQNVHPYLLIPFGYGPRTCAGMRLAEQEMRVVLIKLLQKFRLGWPRNEPELGQQYVMLLRPDRPAKIQFSPRQFTVV